MNKLHHFLSERQGSLPEADRAVALSRAWTARCERHDLNEFSKSFLGVDLDRVEIMAEVS
jgi:hypothetical protein